MEKIIKRSFVGTAAIRERSKELDVPVEWLLAGYIMEQFAAKLATSARSKQLLLKNPGVLGLSGCSRGIHKLHYVYLRQTGEVFSKADFASFLKSTIKWETQTNVEWSWRSHMEDRQLVVELNAVLDDMRMPIELIVEPMDAHMLQHPAGEAAIRFVMENNKTYKVTVYPAEDQLLDDFGEVLSKLELIGDMAVYDRIYETLGLLNFEGRQFQKKLQEYCATKGIVMDAVRYAQMESYRTYPYLIKKWKTYLKKQRRPIPPWEEVYGRMWNFLMPPWEASLQGMVYLGGWIPDLGRYLD